MKQAILTGMNGTVAPALARALSARGWSVRGWDRAIDPPTSEAKVGEFCDRHGPSLVCHVATGPVEWAGWIARACAERRIPLLWTGSVSVFGTGHAAPFTPEMEPDATDDYGRYKIECERVVREANPGAIVARLGWQIGTSAGSNTMTDFLKRKAEEANGRVEASAAWTPSCAFLEDSAEAMAGLIERGEAGVFHVEGNGAGPASGGAGPASSSAALSFYEIARGLGAMLGVGWEVVRTQTPAMDNRMADARVKVRSVRERLGV